MLITWAKPKRRSGYIPTTIKKLKRLLDKDEVLSNTINKMISEYDSCPPFL